MSDNEYVTKHQALSIAQEAARAAVIEILQAIAGTDLSNPDKLREKQKDWDWVADKRQSERETKKKAMWTGIAVICTIIGNIILTVIDFKLGG